MNRRFYILLIFFPLFASAQYDFDTRYFTITATSLPEVPEFNQTDRFKSISSNLPKEKPGSFTLDATPTFASTLKAYRMDTSNYWQPVDMMGASSTTKNYVDASLKIAPKDVKGLRFTVYTSDASSKVKNTVYTEVRGLDLLSSCPPYGICPRCAHYKLGRGY